MNLIPRYRAMSGFSLVELMLALSLGLSLSGVILQGLMADGQNGARFSRLLRERASQKRTLELIKRDLAQATDVSVTPDLEQHACSLAGRNPVLYLRTTAGPITYSVGPAPSTIWRGQVLMRCGPAFGLDGAFSVGSQSINRVVIDALSSQPASWSKCVNHPEAKFGSVIDLGHSSAQPFSGCLLDAKGMLLLRIVQQFGGPGQRSMEIEMEGAHSVL